MMFYLPLYVQNAIYRAPNKQKVYLVRKTGRGALSARREKNRLPQGSYRPGAGRFGVNQGQ